MMFLPDPAGGVVCENKWAGGAVTAELLHEIVLQQESLGSGTRLHCGGTFCQVGHLNKTHFIHTCWQNFL